MHIFHIKGAWIVLWLEAGRILSLLYCSNCSSTESKRQWVQWTWTMLKREWTALCECPYAPAAMSPIYEWLSETHDTHECILSCAQLCTLEVLCVRTLSHMWLFSWVSVYYVHICAPGVVFIYYSFVWVYGSVFSLLSIAMPMCVSMWICVWLLTPVYKCVLCIWVCVQVFLSACILFPFAQSCPLHVSALLVLVCVWVCVPFPVHSCVAEGEVLHI